MAKWVFACDHTVYADTRHETLNELNRDMITEDFVAWAGVTCSAECRVATLPLHAVTFACAIAKAAATKLQRCEMAEAPLKGVRVIELARILAGPWAGQLLADLGADVIKVENPDGGDDTRKWGPPFVIGQDGENLSAAYYHSCNRGKRSVAIDFSTPEGAETVRKLVATADVLIENFKLGGLKKYGLDYDSLTRINPRLVYCSITGFGQDGPYAPRAGYDFIIQGMSGHDVDHRRGRTASRRRSASRSPTSSPGSIRSSPSRRRCAMPRRPAKASTSTWRCSTRRSRCSATRTSIISCRATRRCRWATPT